MSDATYLLAADPGKNGAVVLFHDREIIDYRRLIGKTGQRFFSVDQLPDPIMELAEQIPDDSPVVAVQEALLDHRHTLHKQSTVNNNTTAANWGMLYNLLSVLSDEVDVVRPADWKRRLGFPKKADKRYSLDRARELYPEWADDLKYLNRDGVAEAMLIGYDYLQRT